MKKTLLGITCFLACIFSVKAQTLYGTTTQGGNEAGGTINKFIPATNDLVVAKSFESLAPPINFTLASDGKLYGMTATGGNSNQGVIFSFDPSTSTYTKLKNFNNTDGSPMGNLMQASDGKLYDMTASVIFSFDPFSHTYTKLKDFETMAFENNHYINETGNSPYGSLMQASDGKLYGMTSQGGSNGYGVIFSYDPSSSTYTKIKDYNGANGAYPDYSSAFIEVKDNQNKAPTVSLTTPTNNATYIAPAAHVKLTAAASDSDGTINKVDFYNGTSLLHTETAAPYGFKWRGVPVGNYTITAKATDNSGNVTTSAEVKISVVPNNAPTVSITNPANNQSYPGPATIHLEAAANDPDGRITKVEFYNGSTLLRTELKLPYTYAWRKLPVGNYQITAKAIDNWGAVTTSAVVNISVVPNKVPIVSITSPVNGESITAHATLPLTASAADTDGRIIKVAFYNGTMLLRTERKLPYTYHWQNVTAGTYTITAVATDNWGAQTASAPVTVTVTLPDGIIASGKASSENNKTGKSDAISLNIYPNPATRIVNIYTKDFQQNKQATISVISSSGVIMKAIQSKGSTKTIQLDVSSLVKGVYTIKVISGNASS